MTTAIYKEFQGPPQDERVRDSFHSKEDPKFIPYPDARCQICGDNGYSMVLGYNCQGKIIENKVPCPCTIVIYEKV